ncbi:SAM domain-containing protein [Anaerosacchariphilus polymeriproducens]|uniref:Uncharacterized protein n=1 Tax=Anaerosacchariphilus polymeriproducens TaxID=1812858 RepID=A0A371AXG1_9FIRM|nr:hypothetical protein [Anaerosacchariphilus polymeriproducens]RDU24231.1 hypothetical protein DWV06_05910 [Anaerosacchariphilus polymeriproducens]
MKRDLKLYFERTEAIENDLNSYLKAVTTMETVLRTVCKKLTNCEGKSIDAILDTQEDLEKDIKKCKEEIKDLYELFQGYNKDMQDIMQPKDKGSMMRVDRNDIWWNKYQISCEVDSINSLKAMVLYNNYGYGYNYNDVIDTDDDEERKKQQRNGRKIDEIFNTVVPASYNALKQQMNKLDNFHETKVIPFENMDDTYAAKAGQLLYTYEGNLEWFKRIVGTCVDAVVDIVVGVAKALWDTVVGLITLVGGLVAFAASAVVIGVCKPLDISPPKWASHVFNQGVETAKVLVSLEWIPALGQQIMDSVEEEGIFYAVGYTIGSIAGVKGLDKLGKTAKIAMGGKVSVLKNASCVDDLLRAGLSSTDDLVKAGITSVDDLLKVGVNSLDDLAKVGVNSIDDLVKLGVKSADDFAKLGITSVEQLKKIGITSMDDLAKLGITSSEDLAKIGVKSADDFVEVGSRFTQLKTKVENWAQSEGEKLSKISKRQRDKFNTACVVYDETTGKYYFGRNNGINISGSNKNPILFGESNTSGILPEQSLNKYTVGNCAEVDAVNQALNDGAKLKDLYMGTIHTTNSKFGASKVACENCTYTFKGRVAENYSGWLGE